MPSGRSPGFLNSGLDSDRDYRHMKTPSVRGVKSMGLNDHRRVYSSSHPDNISEVDEDFEKTTNNMGFGSPEEESNMYSSPSKLPQIRSKLNRNFDDSRSPMMGSGMKVPLSAK